MVDTIPPLVLAAFPAITSGVARPFGAGLINETFLVLADEKRFVVQRVNPIFPAAIHGNILAVTRRLAECGITTPELVPTVDNRPYLELDHEVWRAMTFVDGVCFNVPANPECAYAAGSLVARFHSALEGLAHQFAGMRVGVHDTAKHLRNLRDAVNRCQQHPRHSDVAALAADILAGAAELPRLPALPDMVGHGDLKFNNILFAGAEIPCCQQAVALVDLDTVGPVSLAFELGDAWRSWCNRSGEDTKEAVVDLDVFAASLDGYLTARGRDLSEGERRALLLGVEWVSLELASRFAADALLESYFGWDATRYGSRGEHNLVRARGQWALHRALLCSRGKRSTCLAVSA